MPATLTCLPDSMAIDVLENESILQATLRAGIPHVHACGGKGRCSSCRVHILKGLENITARTTCEHTLAQKLQFSATIRLACQTFVKGDVTIRRPVLDALDQKIVQKQVEATALPAGIGEEKTIAVLFSDIVGYTPFAEAISPYDTIHVLNRYFRLMGEVVQKHHGQISDYVGDGIMALFGVTHAEEAVEDAVKAAKEMFAVLPELNRYLLQMYDKQFQIRVGIHYGKVVIGQVGIDNMSKLAAVGDAVNLASRIENKNKELGTSFLLSEDAYDKVKNFIEAENVHIIEVKGKKGHYLVYEINPFYPRQTIQVAQHTTIR